MDSVIVCLANGYGPWWEKGEATRAMESRCAWTISSFSSPVKYPKFKLSTRILSLSPSNALFSNLYHPSMNSLVYSLLAPKSISWIWGDDDGEAEAGEAEGEGEEEGENKKFAQLGSVCMNRN